MMLPRVQFSAIAAGRTLGLALTLTGTLSTATVLFAQAPNNGPPLSSGSGAGTGTGMMGGDSRNTTGTGEMSGRMGGTTGTGTSSGTGPGSWPSNEPMIPSGPIRALPPGRIPVLPPGESIPLGPGAITTFPDNPSLLSSPTVPGMENEPGRDVISSVQPFMLRNAQLITDPSDRAQALQRTANAAIFSNQLDIAHQALAEAAEATLQVPTPLVRDLRLIAIITSLINLSEAILREGKIDLAMPEFDLEFAPEALPNPSPVDRLNVIDRARDEWRRAADLAWRITNITYRVELLNRVVDNTAYGSQTIINEFPHGGDSLHDGQSDREGRAIEARADAILRDASATAVRIERPVWRDRALVTIAQAAAASKQFARGLEVARLIPQPEVRTDALVRIAEAQARRDNGRGATETYAEAARAVASIPLDDPRAVLAGVLIDNLISVGRFDDARSTIVLYPDRPRQLIALGAIAESQGRRGRADDARAWIARDIPPQEQSALYRRVNAGIIAAIEQNRSREISNRER